MVTADMSDQKEKKKRKNKATDEPRPKKKKAVSYDDGPIAVSVVDEQSSWTPIFANAPGLELPKGMSFQPYTKKTPTESRKSKISGTDVLLHSGSHPRLDYVATEPAADSFDRGINHYLGVYDPGKSTLHIMPAKQLTIRSSLKRSFVVDQKLAEEEAKKAAAATAESSLSKYATARNSLREEFGTKKAKKALRSAAANVISASMAGDGSTAITDHSQAVLEGANLTNGTDEEEGDREERKTALSELMNDAHPRPRPNLEAEKPVDVYRLGSVVGRQELDLVNVDDWLAAAARGESIQTPSRFVSFRFNKLSSSQDPRRLKALKYLLHLLQWSAALETRGASRKLPRKERMDEAMAGVGAELVRKIRQKFAPEGTSLNPWHVQRLMLHACAIALVLDGCTTDMYDMQEDLKVTRQEIRQLYKALGCRVEAPTDKEARKLGISGAEAAQRHLAKLRLPFSLPEVRQRRLKKR